jgi:tetratricopeptide (TPR) repeat protein
MIIRVFYLFLIAACWPSSSLFAQNDTVSSACDMPSKKCLSWVTEELGNVKPNSIQWYSLKLMQLDSLMTIKEFTLLKHQLSIFNDNLKLPPMFSIHLNIYQAKLYLIDGNEVRAKTLLTRSLENLQQVNQSFYSPMRIISIANLMHSLKQYDQSLALLERIDREFQNSRDLYLKLELYGNLGHVHKYLKNYDKAITYYKKSLKCAIELGVEQQVAVLHEHVGNMYKATGQPELAELSFINALAHAKKDARDSTINHAKIILAFFYIQQMELDKAKVLATEIDASKIEPHEQQEWLAINTALKADNQ